jgi:hypothetical protein
MTTRAAVALAAAALVTAAAVTEIITGAGLTARIVTIGVLAGVTGGGFVLRLIGPSKGEHAAPRGFTEADERLLPLPATVPRAPTKREPPWDPAPVYQAAPVIEPDAVTHGPPQPEPEPEAYWLAAGTYSRATGEVRTVRVELLPPVAELLGYASTGDAVESMCAEWHSVASIFNKGHVRQVRELLAGES